MADPNRPSTTIDLESRYNTSRVGGAYNAKLAGTSTEFSHQAATYDSTGNFVVNQQKGISNFKGANSQNYSEQSSYAKGLNTTKYHG